MDGMLTNSSAKAIAEVWLGDFAAALACGEAARIAALFADDCYWREAARQATALGNGSAAAQCRTRVEIRQSSDCRRTTG
jgi:hypothetical protein